MSNVAISKTILTEEGVGLGNGRKLESPNAESRDSKEQKYCIGTLFYLWVYHNKVEFTKKAEKIGGN